MNNTPMELTFSDGTTYDLVPKKETPGIELVAGKKYRLTRHSRGLGQGTIIRISDKSKIFKGMSDLMCFEIISGEWANGSEYSPVTKNSALEHFMVEYSALEPLPEEPKELWEPKKTERYEFINSVFEAEEDRNTVHGTDVRRIAAFNAMEHDSAERLASKLKAFTYLWRVATELYGGRQQPLSAHFYPHINGIAWYGVRFETAELCESFKAHASNGTSVKEQFGILFGMEEKR